MADYSVDVKVKLNVEDIQNAVNEKPITAPIVPKITFTDSIDGNDLKSVKDAVQSYFQEDANRVGLRFKEDNNFLQSDLKEIENAINKVSSINGVEIGIGFNKNDWQMLSARILVLDKLEEHFKENSINIQLNIPDENLNSIKNKIDEYFINNPVNLNISETKSTDSNIVEETKNALDEEKNISTEHYKELKLEHQKYLIEKREAQDKSVEESKQKQKELSEEIKNQLHEEIESHKQAFNEKHNNLLEYAEQTKNTSQQLSQEIEQAEQDALSELQNALNANNVTEVFKQETEQLVHLYKQGTIDFASFSDDMLEKMKKAQESGLVSDDVIQKIKKKYDEMSLAHQQSLEKQQQQAEKIREKEIKDIEAQKEKEKKENQKQIEDELKNTQDLYNKKLISAEEYSERMHNILPKAFEAGVSGAQQFQNSLDAVDKELEEANSFTHAFNETMQSFNTSSNSMFNSLMRYFGVTKIFDAVQGSFSKMITEVKNLDVELTEFSKVTDLTAQETEQFIDDSYRLGETVAKTGTEVVTATTLFKKMGYTVDESMDFAKDALMWTNVADGMVSVEDSANMLISTMKAYGEETVSTTQIIDALNEVSNNYSTSSSALSNNLSTVAATLASSGTDLYQTLGLLTAGIEVMPDKASKVANGLKTISQRIRQIDGDTAAKLDDFFGSKGKSRFDETTGQLKSTYDILFEVAGLWNDLTVNERQYIGEVMAGKNQITVLNAVMTNFATAINATETAMNSAGSAAEENKRVLGSIEGHIKAFKSAFSELSRDFIDSDLFKDIVDFGTSIIKWLDNLIKNYKPEIIDALTGIGAAIVGMQLTNAIANVVQLVQTFGTLGPAGLGAAAAIGIVTATLVDFIQRAREANEQFQNLVELGSKGLPTQVPELEKSIKRYEELYELLQKETDGEKRKQYAEELAQIQTALEYIGVDVDLINGKYDDQLSKLKEVLSTQREIELNNKKQAFQESSSEDIVINTIQNNEQAFGLNTGYFRDLPGEYEKRLQEAVDTIYNLNIGGETLKAVLDDNERSIQEKQTALEGAYQEYQEKAIWLHAQASTASSEETRAFYEAQEEQVLAYAGVISQLIESLKGQGEKYSEVVDAASVVVKDKLEEFGFDISSLTEEQLTSLKEAIESDDLWAIDIPLDELGISFDELKAILSDPIQKEGFLKLIEDEELKEQVEALAGTIEDATDTVGTSLSGAMSMMNDYISSLEILNQAHMEFTNNGEISAETLKKIADAGLEAYLIIDEETKSLDVNRDAFMDDNKSIEDNAIAAYVAGQRTQFLADVKAIATNAAYDSQAAQQNEKAAVEELTSALAEENVKAAENVAMQQAMNEASKEGADLTSEQLAGIQARVQSFVSETQAGVAALRQLFNTGSTSSGYTGTSHSVSHGGGSGDSSSGSGSSSSSDNEAEQARRDAEQAAKKAQEAWKNSFEIEYKKLQTYLDAELITHEEYYDALEELNKHFFEGRAEFEEEYWKYQDEIIKGRKKYLEDELENYFKKGESILQHQLNVEYITEEEYYEALTLLYETYYTDKEKYEEEYWKLEEEIYKLRKKQIKELEDELSDLYDQIEDLHKEYIESLEEDSEELETTIGYAIDVLDEEIEKLKAEKTALNEANQALEEQIKLQELEDALEKAKQKKIRVYRKGQGFVYEQDTKAVGEAQSAIDEYKKELAHKKQLSMVDEEIAKLEEYKKAWKDITENYKRSQNEMTAVGVLGENAREKILAREYNAVDSVGSKYESVQERIKAANNATIDNLEEYIGDEATANTLSYEIKRIKDKINEIQSKTVTLQVNTGKSAGNIQNIINSITTLKNKLEQSYSTVNLDDWLTEWKKTIDEAYKYSQDYGITPPGGGGGGGDGGGGGGGGSTSGGFKVGDWVTIPDSDVPYAPFRGKRFKIVQFENNGETAALLVEGGQEGQITYRVPVSHLNKSTSGSGGDDPGDDDDPGDGGSGEPSYSVPVMDANGNIAGYNWYDSDGNLLYYEPAYASGTLGTTSKRFRVNENGLEAMVTPEGTVISAPTTGYGVINNKYTERLTDFASDPMSFLNKAFSGYSGTYQNNPPTNEVININGNLNLPNVTDGQSFVDSIRNVALQYTTRRR